MGLFAWHDSNLTIVDTVAAYHTSVMYQRLAMSTLRARGSPTVCRYCKDVNGPIDPGSFRKLHAEFLAESVTVRGYRLPFEPI